MADLIGRVQNSTINLSTGKEVLAKMASSGQPAGEIIARQGLAQISDAAALEQVIEQVMRENPGPVDEYLGGSTKILGWLIGQVMRATHGQANPQVVRKLLQAQLEALRE